MTPYDAEHINDARLLVVEDESIVAMDIIHQLESFGYPAPEWVTTGEEAIVMADELRPDLVLMDIALAGELTGIEAAAVIRDFYALPVLFLTANSDRATVQNAKGISPAGFVLKPFEKRELEVAVEMAIYRSRLERELEASLHRVEAERAKSEAIIAGIGMGLSMQDPDFRILYQNRLLQETVGDCVGEYCYKAYENKDRVCDECPLAEVFATGVVQSMEKEVVVKGQKTYLELTISPLKNEQGEVVAGVELIRDITERKQMELALTESEERYRKLVEFTPTGIVTLRNGAIEFVNPAGVAIFGANDGAELSGSSFLDFFAPEYFDVITSQLGTVDIDKQEAVEAELLRLDGRSVDVEIIFAPITTESTGLVQAIVHNISERKRAEQVIRQMAYYDALTGLPNRRLFDDRLNLALAQARRFGRRMAILFIDLDHFKTINDRLGHGMGDLLLKAAAVRLRDCCRRESETVARFGGDEFIILLPEITGISEVTGLVDNISREFRKQFEIKGNILATNLSIGVSTFPEDGDDLQTLVMHADIALYRAKAEGRATCRYFRDLPADSAPA